MIRHNLLLALRNFRKYKNSFFINLIGLSTGLACTLLIFLWVQDELHMNTFHEKDARLFQVMEHQEYSDRIFTTASTPGLLAETLAEEIPEIEFAATTTWVETHTLSVGELNIQAEGYHVGPDYFNIFSYGLVEGNPSQVLADKNSIVISKELAKSLFGEDADVIGKEVEFQHETTFLVSGVFEGTPRHSSFQFDFVLSFEIYKDENPWVTNWQSNGPSTYAILVEGANAEEVSEKIADFIRPRNENTNVTLFLQKYSDRHLYGRFENGQAAGGRIEYVQLFSAIAIFILVIACINFMNLSTARASRRSKEVGIKKAVGARQSSLIFQYLGESLVLAFISLLLGLLIVALVLPQFNEITDKQMSLQLDPIIIMWFLGITVTTGVISGSYPALYLSGFAAVRVLKGEVKGSLGELWARRGLVIFQFTLSVILIVSVLVIYQQIQFVQSKNLGYNLDNVIYFDVEGRAEEAQETFLSELRQIPGVVNASAVAHSMVGRNNNTSGLVWEGKDPDSRILFENMRVDHDFLETMDIEILQGRDFSREFSTDTAKIIVNETALEIMAFEDPIGQGIRLWDRYDLEVIGVVKDFHFQSLHETVKPAFIWLRPQHAWNVMVRIEAGREKETLDELSIFYQEFNPGFTFDFAFLDARYQQQYANERRVGTLSRYFAGFAILISCLGLFGLVAFTAERRVKEIGIRKVLGSSVAKIVLLLSGDFTRMVVVAIILGLPLSYWLVSYWLERFEFRIELGVTYFAGAGIMALLVAWLTVGLQAFKAANINPTECLRDE